MGKISDLYNLQLRKLDDVKGIMVESKDRVNELHEEIKGEVLTTTGLTTLNSTSKTAIWNLWAFVTACSIWLHEFIWVKYRYFLEEAARFAQPHTASWYWRRALEYQDGDTVIVTNGVVGYATINPSLQIIAAAAVVEANGGIIVKVAKEVSGSLAPLSGPELTGFEAYLDEYKDAGVVSNVVSQNADVLKMVATIYFDPSKQSLSAFQAALELAITAYVQNLPFDGTFRRLHLVDAMQAVNGFVDVEFDQLFASVAYVMTPFFTAIGLSYQTVAGYMNIDANFPLNANLTYQPI
jgi:hypothetical protein